jgi:hypothetical protein
MYLMWRCDVTKQDADMIAATKPDVPFRGHLHLPFQPVDAMFKTFVSQWRLVDWGARDGAAPFMIARSSSTDPGKVVPVGVLCSADVFREWANENGFSKGLSFRIEGLMAPPGSSPLQGSST